MAQATVQPVSRPPASGFDPEYDGPTTFGHPRALYVLFFAEMWERFSYYGMRALLTLYMIQYLHFGTEEAGGVYGDYTGLVYLTPLLGGFIADRYLGLRRAIMVGAVLMAIGHGLMAVDALPFFYLALICLILGNGFFKPNISTLVGQLYRTGDPRRDGGFTIFYMGINAGAFLAGIVCPTIGQAHWGEVKDAWYMRPFHGVVAAILGKRELTDDVPLWHIGFGLAAIGMLMGLAVFWWGQRYLGKKGLVPAGKPKAEVGAPASEPLSSTERTRLLTIGALGIAFAIFQMWRTMHPSTLAVGASAPGVLTGLRAMLWPLVFTIAFSIWVYLMGRCKGDERKRVNAIFLIGIFVMVFWAAFEQAGSSMTLFADRSTQLSFAGVGFRSGNFQSANALFIIILAPIFSAVWTWLAVKGRDPSTAIKMVLGIAFNCVAFGLLVVAAKEAATGTAAHPVLVSPLWLTAAYFLQTCGELCLSPVGLSMVTKLAPVRFAGMMMGVWFLANAFANKLAGIAGGMYEKFETPNLFGFVGLTLLVAALILLCFVPVLKRWMGKVA